MFCVYWELNAAPSKHEALNQCWFDAGPASQMVGQHWVNVVFDGSVDECFAPKLNNKFRLIHSLYCLHELFNNINYKSHWHYIYYLSTFMVMLLEGRHRQFFVHKKVDPHSLILSQCEMFELSIPHALLTMYIHVQIYQDRPCFVILRASNTARQPPCTTKCLLLISKYSSDEWKINWNEKHRFKYKTIKSRL